MRATSFIFFSVSTSSPSQAVSCVAGWRGLNLLFLFLIVSSGRFRKVRIISPRRFRKVRIISPRRFKKVRIISPRRFRKVRIISPREFRKVRWISPERFRKVKSKTWCIALILNRIILTHGRSVSMYVWMTMRTKGMMRLKISQTSTILM